MECKGIGKYTEESKLGASRMSFKRKEIKDRPVSTWQKERV